MINKTHVIWALVLFYGIISSAQDYAYNGNPDTSFFTARDLAFTGNRVVARDTLNHILTKYPDYADVRNLLAKTLSWDGNYEEARKHFNRIHSIERKNKEVWLATVKNEIYAKEYYLAIGLANKALKYLKNDAEIMALKSYALSEIKKPKEVTKKRSQKVLVKMPEKDSIEAAPKKNRIAISNAFEVFDKIYNNMIYASVEYKRETKLGAVIPRINYNNRFETHGIQYETDFYPKFSKKWYAHLNYGYSASPIFPNHSAGGELYANFANGIEASAGMRYLDFESTKATIYTGSVGLYKGNYYFSLRPYVTPNPAGNIGVSGNFLARKYLKSADHYLGIRAGMGYSPELRQLRSGTQLLAETLLYVESQQVQLEYQFTGWLNSNSYRANLGIARQELIFDSGNFFWAISAGITCQVKF